MLRAPLASSACRSTRTRAAGLSRQRGLNLIEVMVAIVILSIGLLGMAALMGVSIRNTQSANYRSQATNLAFDYIEMVRANRANMGRYIRNGFTDPAACAAPEQPVDITGCGSVDACDVGRWTRELCYTLPNGRGRAQITRPVAGIDEFDIEVGVCWTDDRSLSDTSMTADCGGESETLFVVRSGL